MKSTAAKSTKRTTRRDPSPYPKGWDRKRVQSLIDYYENLSDDDAIAEADAAYKDRASAMVQVPLKLVPRVQMLLLKCAG